MPPKAKFAKEAIIDTAYNMVRKHGTEILTARGLAAELGSSTAPIFTLFHSIDEIQQLVIERAKTLYEKGLHESLDEDLPFKAMGMNYISFAAREPQLFRLLFMGADSSSEFTNYLPGNNEDAHFVLENITQIYGWSEHRARWLYNHLSVYTHGLAVLFAQGQLVFTKEEASKLLSEVYHALIKEDKNE